MKLTENQIDELYKFTREHYVYFYDVQSELVDHLANDIEEIWLDKPKLSFENARTKLADCQRIRRYYLQKAERRRPHRFQSSRCPQCLPARHRL